jgi:hypothetical protein
VGWFLGGLAHLIKAETGKFHVPLFIISALGITLGRILRVFGTVCTMRSHGPCACIQSAKVLAVIFGCFAVVAIVLLPPAEVGAIPVPGWIVAAVFQILMVLLLFIFSTATILKIEAKAVWAPITAILMFVLGVVVNLTKPSPFKYATDFNDNGLFHTFFIWEAAASFYALWVVADTPAMAGKKENTDEDGTAQERV